MKNPNSFEEFYALLHTMNHRERFVYNDTNFLHPVEIYFTINDKQYQNITITTYNSRLQKNEAITRSLNPLYVSNKNQFQKLYNQIFGDNNED